MFLATKFDNLKQPNSYGKYTYTTPTEISAAKGLTLSNSKYKVSEPDDGADYDDEYSAYSRGENEEAITSLLFEVPVSEGRFAVRIANVKFPTSTSAENNMALKIIGYRS